MKWCHRLTEWSLNDKKTSPCLNCPFSNAINQNNQEDKKYMLQIHFHLFMELAFIYIGDFHWIQLITYFFIIFNQKVERTSGIDGQYDLMSHKLVRFLHLFISIQLNIIWLFIIVSTLQHWLLIKLIVNLIFFTLFCQLSGFFLKNI